MVLSNGSLSILDINQQVLDLQTFPFELAEKIVRLFGYGMYGLPGSAAPACVVRGVRRHP